MKGILKDLTMNRDGTQNVTITVTSDFRKRFDQMKDYPVSVEVKRYSAPRTKTANDFCWAMCTDIGNAMKPPIPKEMVYRQAIRDVGEYEALPIRNDAVKTFQERWASKGVGWFVEIIDDSKIPGYKLVFAYYGTSVYSKESMGRVIDYLKQDMDNMGIPIPFSKEEEKRMLGR